MIQETDAEARQHLNSALERLTTASVLGERSFPVPEDLKDKAFLIATLPWPAPKEDA